MERNPYAPPSANVEPVPEPPSDAELAGKGRRFANMLIDTVGYYILAIAIGVILGLAGAESMLNQVAEGPMSLVFGAAILLLYYVPLEVLTGRTLGKLITGTRTVTESGESPGFLQVLGRTCARMIPFEVFSFLGSPSVGWHDKLSRTRVVRTRR